MNRNLFDRLSIAVTVGFFLLAHTPISLGQAFEWVKLPAISGHVNSCSFLDINQDYLVDIALTYDKRQAELFVNAGKGVFHPQIFLTESDLLQSMSWVDYDNDGDLDLFGIQKKGGFYVYEEFQEASIFERLKSPLANFPTFISNINWGDIDQDGWLDMFICRNSPNQTNCFYRYDQNEGFVSFKQLKWLQDSASLSISSSWVDWDQDGDEDLFVANKGPNQMYENLGGGLMKKIHSSPILVDSGNTQAHHWIDYDNDGDLDLFLANSGQANQLFCNKGYGKFKLHKKSVLSHASSDTQASSWVDIDNDGDLDLLISEKVDAHTHRQKLFMNDGNGQFCLSEKVLPFFNQKKIRSFIWSDFDLDGLQDLLVVYDSDSMLPIQLYKNTHEQRHWILLKCQGKSSNRQAIGVKVYIKALIDGKLQWQTRVLQAHTSPSSQGSHLLHFGLGDAQSINAMRIEWPSGIIQYFSNVATNQLYLCEEEESLRVLEVDEEGKILDFSVRASDHR